MPAYRPRWTQVTVVPGLTVMFFALGLPCSPCAGCATRTVRHGARGRGAADASREVSGGQTVKARGNRMKRLSWLVALSLLMLSALAPAAWAQGEGVTVGTEDNFFGTKRRRRATPRMG